MNINLILTSLVFVDARINCLTTSTSAFLSNRFYKSASPALLPLPLALGPKGFASKSARNV
jgi:hypothetical protein